jgi:capsular polysaccharide transport system ATP-binding protein
MIILKDVSKRYIVERVPGKWVLQGVSLVIPPKACIGVIGNKGVGKSTLLRLIAGIESPTAGRYERNGRIAAPMRYIQNFQPLLSGRQNAKFICRINGYADEIEERLSRIEDMVGLQAKFDKPVSTYTPVMKSRLSFALSMAFDFDIYISDGFNFSGETGFKDKGLAEAALKKLTEHAGIIMTAQGAQGADTLRRYCKSGIRVHDGKAEWFDNIEDALEAQKKSQPPVQPKVSANPQVQPAPEHMQPMIAKIKQMQNTLTTLNKALNGHPVCVIEKQIPWLTQVAKNVGMALATKDRISDCGYRLRAGMIPILQVRGAGGQMIEYFDMSSQCEKIESTPESE